MSNDKEITMGLSVAVSRVFFHACLILVVMPACFPLVSSAVSDTPGESSLDPSAETAAPDEYPWPMLMAGLVSPNRMASRYDLRDHNLITPVKNQNGMRPDGISDLGTSVGLCWAFASLSSFESSLLKQGIVASPTDREANLSPWHLGNYIGYNKPVYECNNEPLPGVVPATGPGYWKEHAGWGGGGAFWTSDYITRGDGPLLWQDAPMPNDQMSRRETLQKPVKGNPVNYLVKEMLLFDPEDFTDNSDSIDELTFRNIIKGVLLRYGAVQSMIHLEAIDCPGIERQTCNGVTYNNQRYMDKANNNMYTYERDTCEMDNFCTDEFTHAVSIAGWDDYREISVDGHETRGAWLIKDSIGDNSHDKGYFWVAYADKIHLQFMAAAFVALSGDGYKHPSSYQTHPGALSDISEVGEIGDAHALDLGSYAYLLNGYSAARKDSWGIARFQLDTSENLKGVGIVTGNKNETVKVRLYRSWEHFVTDRDNPLYAQTFSVAEKGYHLLLLEKEVALTAGQELVIGIGFEYAPNNSKEPLVYVKDKAFQGPATYRASYHRQSGWTDPEPYEEMYPDSWAGFYLQAVMASEK